MKISDKLVNYLMFGQTIIEVKMEKLITHTFLPWRNFVTLFCDQGEDGSHAHGRVGPLSVYHFGYPLF